MICENKETLRYEGIEANYLEQTVTYQNHEIMFTDREFQVLYLLLKYPGRIFSKRQIYEQVTNDEDKVDYHTVEITISRIRKKLECCSGRNDFIVTIRGRGYKFRKQ